MKGYGVQEICFTLFIREKALSPPRRFRRRFLRFSSPKCPSHRAHYRNAANSPPLRRAFSSSGLGRCRTLRSGREKEWINRHGISFDKSRSWSGNLSLVIWVLCTGQSSSTLRTSCSVVHFSLPPIHMHTSTHIHLHHDEPPKFVNLSSNRFVFVVFAGHHLPRPR